MSDAGIPSVVYVEGYSAGVGMITARLLQPQGSQESDSFVSMSVLSYGIGRNIRGQHTDVTNTTTEIYTGEEVLVWLGDANNRATAQANWDLGDAAVVQDYEVAGNMKTGTKNELTPEERQNTTDPLSFYYVDQGQNRKIKVSFVFEGRNETRFATVNVIGPTKVDSTDPASINGSFNNPVVIYEKNNKLWAGFGRNTLASERDPNNPDVVIGNTTEGMRAFPTPYTQVPGTVAYVQTVALSAHLTNDAGERILDRDNEVGLDSQFPYEIDYNSNPYGTEDSPSIEITASLNVREAEYNGKFTTYLMYRPDLGPNANTKTIWVPLAKLDWEVHFKLILNAEMEWQHAFVPVLTSGNINGTKTTEFPQWERLVEGQGN